MTIAEHDEYLMSAANSLYLQNADEIARKRARDREDYYRDKRAFEALKVKYAEQASSLAEKNQKYAALQNENTALQNELSELRAKLAQYES